MRKNRRIVITPTDDYDQLEKKIGMANLLLVAREIEDGTASEQVKTHFLRLHSRESQAKIEKLEAEVRLANARIHELESQTNVEEGIEAMRDALRKYTIPAYIQV